jgi:hypothetical protein
LLHLIDKFINSNTTVKQKMLQWRALPLLSLQHLPPLACLPAPTELRSGTSAVPDLGSAFGSTVDKHPLDLSVPQLVFQLSIRILLGKKDG